MNALDASRKLFSVEREINTLKSKTSSNAQAIATYDYVGEDEKLKMEKENIESYPKLESLIAEKEQIESALKKVNID